MSDKTLSVIVRPAPRGSKKGWVPITAKVPPEYMEGLRLLSERRPAFRDSLVCEGVEMLLKAEGLLAA